MISEKKKLTMVESSIFFSQTKKREAN